MGLAVRADRRHAPRLMTDLVLHQFPGAYGMESLSPFCTKLASYLQLAGVQISLNRTVPNRVNMGK